MSRRPEVSIPRIALTPPEAAAALGVGSTFFDEQIAPELKLIRRGRKRPSKRGRRGILRRGRLRSTASRLPEPRHRRRHTVSQVPTKARTGEETNGRPLG